MLAEHVEEMTEWLTKFADADIQHADMKVKMSKTYTKTVQRQK